MSGPQIAWDAPSSAQSSAPQIKWDDEKQQPGFLDKEIPQTTTSNSFWGQLGDEVLHPLNPATMSGIQSVGRGVRGAVTGIGRTIAHPIDTAKGLLNAPSELASEVKELPGAIRDINQSSDPTQYYLKAAQDTAGEGAGQALTALGTEGLARGAGWGVGKVARPVATRLYQSALKPSTALGAPRIARMVDTGLNEAIPVSSGGAAKLGSAIGDVNDQIQSTIDAAPTRTISKGKVLQRLNPVADRFAEQVNPTSDLDAIAKSGNEFAETHPGDIPGPSAQRIKQGTYRAIGEKNFGELGGAATEAQKAMARGLKEELANQYPELKDLNARDSRLIDLQDALERAVVRSANREPLGLGGPVAGAATKAITGSTPAAFGIAYLKMALRDPGVKSALAIALKNAGRTIARPGVGASVPLIGGTSRLGGDQTSER